MGPATSPLETNMFLRIATATTALFAASLAPAFADTASDIDTCLAALEAEAPDAAFTFERKSGASVTKIKFEMETADGETKDVVCKVKRGEVVELDMGE